MLTGRSFAVSLALVLAGAVSADPPSARPITCTPDPAKPECAEGSRVQVINQDNAKLQELQAARTQFKADVAKRGEIQTQLNEAKKKLKDHEPVLADAERELNAAREALAAVPPPPDFLGAVGNVLTLQGIDPNGGRRDEARRRVETKQREFDEEKAEHTILETAVTALETALKVADTALFGGPLDTTRFAQLPTDPDKLAALTSDDLLEGGVGGASGSAVEKLRGLAQERQRFLEEDNASGIQGSNRAVVEHCCQRTPPADARAELGIEPVAGEQDGSGGQATPQDVYFADSTPVPGGTQFTPGQPLPAGQTQYTIQPGDSLWSITERILGPGATNAQINENYRKLELYLASRDDNPAVINPGDVIDFDQAAAAMGVNRS